MLAEPVNNELSSTVRENKPARCTHRPLRETLREEASGYSTYVVGKSLPLIFNVGALKSIQQPEEALTHKRRKSICNGLLPSVPGEKGL